MKLYTYFRSSAAYRVRIALNLKGIAYEAIPIHLTKDGGAQHSAPFRAVNPQGRVPALALDDGDILTQSLAIIEYIDETHPKPPLLPSDPLARAKVRALGGSDRLRHPSAQQSDCAPISAPRTQARAARDRRLVSPLDTAGLRRARGDAQAGAVFATVGEVTLADVCLVPQVYNARRLKVPLDKFPNIVAVDAACLKLPAFDKARPENQPDAE